MNKQKQFGGTPDHDHRSEYLKLARWLQQVLATSPQPQLKTDIPPKKDDNNQLELLLVSDYHLPFYQQLPDFVEALHNKDPQVIVHYAPLLYHLVGCPACHSAYLDIYDAMGAALHADKEHLPLEQETRPLTLAATPTRMLVHLSKALISQAEAVLYQARRDHTDGNVAARSLLQLAIKISARIVQSDMRNRALRDLVRVATLFDGPRGPAGVEEDPAVHSYSPALAGAGGRRGRTLRRAETPMRSADISAEQHVIYLQSNRLDGSITQNEDMLELHLEDLEESLRGHYITIDVPLGSLLEPVRWVGGNPRAIRSMAPVDEQGSLSTPLGQTELRLSNPDQRNLLEVTFMLLQVRIAN